eukprot:1578270-Alexandrium_andersonii.AAC.1
MQSKAVKKHVYEKVAAYFAYTFKVLQSGLFPTAGFEGRPFDPRSRTARSPGEPFLGGVTAAFAGFKADGKARVEANAFCRGPSASYVCDECFATQAFAG